MDDCILPNLRGEERVVLHLRALFEKRGYQLFRMGSFEEYDLYMQNRPFLKGEDVISFTSADGRLMALKPDLTLSLVKNTPSGETRKVYYNEHVFRRNKASGEYREIRQMGLEYLGGEGVQAEAEVLLLAAESLSAVGPSALDLSHMEFIEAMLAPFGACEQRALALEALREKSPHGMREAAKSAGLEQDKTEKLAVLATLSGPFEETYRKAQELAQDVPGAQKPLLELESVAKKIGETEGVQLRLDFSILNDIDYYNGLIFQGFVKGASQALLSGGRYDNLMQRFQKRQGALGFALYLNVLEDSTVLSRRANNRPADDYLNVALPKGRLGNQVYGLFEKAGFSCEGIGEKSRKLVFEDPQSRVRYFLVKPTDVDIYVEHGAADIGVVGKDILLESGAEVLELLDLDLGKCKLAVAGKKGFVPDPAATLRVASKYPNVARRYYAGQSQAVEVIKLNGSIELAPIIGLADVIVDIVETGSTLKENELAVLADVAPSSARLIANRASWRFKGEVIRRLLDRLEGLL
ncbi:ATP phosphoribosyltransferase [Ruminococcaceae bacterium OttesenSCG-928-I18]|nr:ATP phosphoribosyltransferase [Ruminococcaceae bacterium OttesenSCG-928-I18]